MLSYFENRILLKRVLRMWPVLYIVLQLDFAPLVLRHHSDGSILLLSGGIRKLQHKEQDDDRDGDLFAVIHLNPNHGPLIMSAECACLVTHCGK